MSGFMMSTVIYSAGGVLGFLVTLALVSGAGDQDISSWISINLGQSTWLFTACLLAFGATLNQLRQMLQQQADYQSVAQLDQLSDVLIHVFVGIGVIWTAIGMRNALVATLAVPDTLGTEASHVLARLVDGGILLALSTTIVGAIGGYLMRLFKTVSIGAVLSGYYQQRAAEPVQAALSRLSNIERLLEEMNAEQRR